MQSQHRGLWQWLPPRPLPEKGKEVASTTASTMGGRPWFWKQPGGSAGLGGKSQLCLYLASASGMPWPLGLISLLEQRALRPRQALQ